MNNAPKVDAVEASAMSKLIVTEKPISAMARPRELARIRADLLRYTMALSGQGPSILGRLSQRLKSRLSGDPDQPIKIQIEALKAREAKLATDIIEGILTPLTEAEAWAVRAFFAKQQIYLQRCLEAGTLEDKPGPDAEAVKMAKDAAKEAIALVGGNYWVAKWIEMALKRRTDKGLVPYFTAAQIINVEPEALEYIFNLYHEAFTLTDDEIKKFAAPPIQAAN